MLLLLSLLALSLSQDADQSRRTKLGSCLFLVRTKLSQEQEDFESFFQSFPKEIEDVIMNKAVANMLEQCLESLSEDQALSIMLDFQTEKKIPDVASLMPFDKDAFTEKADFELTPSQVQLFEDIKDAQAKAQASNEGYNDQYVGEEPESFVSQEPLPLAHFGWGYIMVIFGIFGGFFYWATKKVLKPEAPKKTRKSKKNK